MQILKYGDLTLKEKSKDVIDFDDQLRREADDMYQTMIKEKGIGLAAPQVGLLKNLIIIDIEDEVGRQDFVNPKITKYSDDYIIEEEGCLSVPGIYAKVKRYKKITVEAKNLLGQTMIFEAQDLLARVIQHEMDHLDGVLFVDRLDDMDKKRLKSELKRLKKKYHKVLA